MNLTESATIWATMENSIHPEYGVIMISFPISREAYDSYMEKLRSMGIGDPLKRECRVVSVLSDYPVLKPLEIMTVNVDELDYLAKRLESFDVGEAAQFQAMAHQFELTELKDLINLTFCCQQATVVTDFSDLEQVGRDHYMNLHGGCAPTKELEQLNGTETAKQLIDSGNGVITPYGVVFDNGMKLEQHYDGNHFPAYHYGQDGLFTDEGVPVVLDQVVKEMAESQSNIWTHIISLRREDAARLGYDSAEDWMQLLRSKRNEIARQMRIKPENFRWYAAFHDAGHHPHVHMMAYSIDPKEAYLSEQGIENIKGELAREIFRQDHISIYQKQTKYRDLLREQGRVSVAEIVAQINAGNYRNSKVEALLVQLSERLSHTSGKKVYGYLKTDVKTIVDEIVAELAMDERIRKLYDLWYDQREDVLRSYTDHFPERIPLAQNKEFKPIRNAVIQEAMKIVNGIQQAAGLEPQQDVWDVGRPMGDKHDVEAMVDPAYRMENFQPRFTDEGTQISNPDSADMEQRDTPTIRSADSGDWWSDTYKQARAYLYGTKEEKPDFSKAMPLLLTEANCGNGYACYDLGRMHQQGLGCEENEEEAQRWFSMALEAFQDAEQAAKKPGYLRYRIGKCYAYGHGTEQNYEESAWWFHRAVEENNPFAAYSLGGQYLRGQGVEQSDTEAYKLFIMAANQGNAYAQYQLGRMCKDGIGTEVDLEESKLWYAKAYAGFLRMEETMADDKLYYRLGAMNMTGTGTNLDLEQARYYFEKAAELGNTDALYGLGKLYLKQEFTGYDPHKTVKFLEQAAENGNSFAEYQLGKIYYFGNGIRADTKKGLEYLRSAATHGNEYAANLLQAIQHQQTVGVAQCTASLIAQLGRMFQEQEQKQSRHQRQRMDKKLRQEMQEKKQAMGLKD